MFILGLKIALTFLVLAMAFSFASHGFEGKRRLFLVNVCDVMCLGIVPGVIMAIWGMFP